MLNQKPKIKNLENIKIKGNMSEKYLKKENYLKSFIKFNSLSGSRENCFLINENESALHRDTKYKICVELIKRGYKIFTEVEFKNNLGRADILCFDKKGNGTIFEIINSEKEDSIKEKLDKYPIDFNFETIICNKKIEEQLTL